MGEKNKDKPLVWLKGEVKTPPFSPAARLEAGFLLRRLQRSECRTRGRCRRSDPDATSCEFNDERMTWRIVYRIDPDAIVILEVFKKSTRQTPAEIIEVCKRRLRLYDDE